MDFKFISSPFPLEQYRFNNDEYSGDMQLVDKIRCALEPDNPLLVKEYLRIHEVLLIEDKRALLVSHFNLLLDTAADECLPLHWRTLCFDYIHQPLFALQRIAHSAKNKNELAYLFTELRVMGQYLFH